jgi:hypothetical protein
MPQKRMRELVRVAVREGLDSEDEDGEPTTLLIGSWRFVGTGHTTTGDARTTIRESVVLRHVCGTKPFAGAHTNAPGRVINPLTWDFVLRSG